MGRLSLRKYLMSLKWVGLLLVPMVTYAAVRYDNLIISGTESIGTTLAPNSKSILDMVSTTKGFLEPRMSTVQRDAIAAVPLGLQVFNASTGFMNYYSTSWRELVDTDSAQVVSGKSVSGSTNTLTNIPAATAISGILPVVNGGTGLSTGTDGGLLGFIASGTISSSSSLTVNQLIKGGGAGATPSTFTACSNGQIVKWAGGIPACGTDSGASGVAYDSITSTGSTSTANGAIALSGASFNLQLHTAVGNSGEILDIFHNGTSLTQVYTLLTASGTSETIGGIASGAYALYTNGERLRLISDGVNWAILSHQANTGWVSDGTLVFSATRAYIYTVTAASATAGAVYSNNGFLFTVTITIAGGTTLTSSGTGTPTVSGTLTKVSGTGDATITFSSRALSVPVVGTGSVVNTVHYRRHGSMMDQWIHLQYTSAGTSGTGDYIVTIAGAQTADTTFITPYPTHGISSGFVTNATIMAASFKCFGTLQIGNGGSYGLVQAGNMFSPTGFRINVLQTINTNMTWGQTDGLAFGSNNSSYNILCEIPISGWQP